MSQIVLDTNVLVSALLSPYGKANRILRLILEKKISLLADERIFLEYESVIARPKFSFTQEWIQPILKRLRDCAIMVSVSGTTCHLPDPDDAMFLEVAMAGKADALVTGNQRHFPKQATRPISVMSPDEFLKSHTA